MWRAGSGPPQEPSFGRGPAPSPQNRPLTSCVCRRYGHGPRSYAVRVGDYHTLVPEEFEEEIGVEQIIIHGVYRPDSSDYDIALVRLRGPGGRCAQLSSHVLPACLPLWRERPHKTASNCHITGWGDTGNGDTAQLLSGSGSPTRPVCLQLAVKA